MQTAKRPAFLTFDLEDYTRLRRRIHGLESRESGEAIERGLEQFLSVLPPGARCTFFTTGHVGRSRPGLVRRLAEAGHEIGCHGDEHEDLARCDRAAFSGILDRATKTLEDASGRPVTGFRAPSFRLPQDRSWFFEELAENGYRYDSSVVQVGSRASSEPYDIIETAAGKIAEFPVYRISVPFGPAIRVVGGTYFRLLPKWAVRRVLRRAEQLGYPMLLWMHASDFYPGRASISWGEAWQRGALSGVRWPLERLVECAGSAGAASKLGAVSADFRLDNALRTQFIF